VEVAQGVGLSLVSDESYFAKYPTRYVIERNGFTIINKRINSKRFQAVLNPQGGVSVVPTDSKKEFSLLKEADALAQTMAEAAVNIQKAMRGIPQEVEIQLSWKDNKWTCIILQTSALLEHAIEETVDGPPSEGQELAAGAPPAGASKPADVTKPRTRSLLSSL
jgi:hypothetical protein